MTVFERSKDRLLVSCTFVRCPGEGGGGVKRKRFVKKNKSRVRKKTRKI